MIPLLTREEARAIDRDAVERLGLPSLLLMENAARGALEHLERHHARRLERVVLVGGVGQNGGDAWALARHLHALGSDVRCVLVGDRAKLSGDAAINFAALEPLGVAISAEGELTFDDATLLVDGLFGTGLSRPVEGAYAAAIDAMNASGVPIVALDVPSGIDADIGSVLGTAICAASTVTFAGQKRGLHQFPGVAHAGLVELASIGVPGPTSSAVQLLERADIAGLVPFRAEDAHKGTAGHVLVIAGGRGKTGAAILCGLGALRGGAGLVTIAAREPTRSAIEGRVIELMVEPLGDGSPAELTKLTKGKRAAAIGPGMGEDEAARALARTLSLELPIPAVLDADALNAFPGDVKALAKAKAPRVLTPHPGEAARLLWCSVEDVQRDRYGAARELAQRSQQHVVLKGARSIVAAPDGTMFVVPEGTPALGVAGTGDVLAGALAAQLSNQAPMAAACVAVWIHAVAGTIAAKADRGLLASEVADALPSAVQQCRKSPESVR